MEISGNPVKIWYQIDELSEGLLLGTGVVWLIWSSSQSVSMHRPTRFAQHLCRKAAVESIYICLPLRVSKLPAGAGVVKRVKRIDFSSILYRFLAKFPL